MDTTSTEERLLCPSFQREMLEDAQLCSCPGTQVFRGDIGRGSAPWKIILLIYVVARQEFVFRGQ